MTIAWSIRMPIEIAIPASDMMLDGMPNSRIRMNDTRTDNGNVTQITNALPTCMRISNTAIDAMIVSCVRISVSV